MKQLITLLFLTTISWSAQANAAMPGIWNTGKGGTFQFVFKGDSIHFGKIKMKRELVLVNLYPGFAVVKGEYYFINNSSEKVTLHAGYPKTGTYPAGPADYVQYEAPYGLKVLVNDVVTKVKEVPDSLLESADFDVSEQWYYWVMDFPPGVEIKVTVYFLTYNHSAKRVQGYNHSEGAAFAYVLESGRAWEGAIDEGRILINLHGELSVNQIKGLMPLNLFKGDEKHLEYSFVNLEPSSDNNILVWYERIGEGINFEETILRDQEKYFAEIDAFPLNEFGQASFATISKSDFEASGMGNFFVGALFFLVLFGPWILGAVILIVIVYFIWKRVKKS